MTLLKSILSLTLLISMSCISAKDRQSDPQVVNYVNLQEYLGTWYEVARFYDHPFQEDCEQTKANYSIQKKFIKVENTCITKNGEKKIAKALATVKDKETNAKLRVSFVPFFNRFGLFAGDYWILDVNESAYSLVGSPDRKFLWILSRTPELDETILEDLKHKALMEGFDLSKLIKTKTWKD